MLAGSGVQQYSSLHEIKDTRMACDILANDYTLSNTYSYPGAWSSVRKGLKSKEPAVRYNALLSIRLLGNNVDRTLSDLHGQHDLVNILIELSASEENLIARTLSCICLAICVSSFGKLKGSIRRLSFHTILCELLKLFPSNTSKLKDPTVFDIRTNITKSRFDARIQMLYAVSYTFSLPEASNDFFLNYIDKLMVSIVTFNSHALLKSAVLRLLARNLPLTNQNRIRIEHFYRKPVQAMLSAFRDETDSQKPAVATLLSSLHLFMSVWYPLPTDSTILFTKDMDGETPEFTGFAAKRRVYLESLDDGDVLFDELDEDQLEVIIEKASTNPYQPLDDFDFQSNTFDKWPSLENHEESKYVSSHLVPASLLISAAARNHKPMKKILMPEPNTLTFKITSNQIEFSSSSSMQKLFLENNTSDDVEFALQLSDAEYFAVVPSFGTVPKLGSLPVKLTFKRNFLKKSGPVKGYLFVRSIEGYPIERIALTGMNLPGIVTSSTTVDFGILPPGETRSSVLCLTNMLNVDCPVLMILIPSENSSIFQIPQAQMLLPASDSKHVTFKASCIKEGDIKAEFLIVAYGQQFIKVQLIARGGRSLKITEETVNFGPTDIFFSSVFKKITFENNNRTCSVPITFNSSSNEIIINQQKDLILKPKEIRSVPIEFLSNFSGKRTEKIIVYAPNNGDGTVIDVNAFSGPALKVPIHEDIYLVPIILGQKTFVRIPISNLTQDDIFFSACVPAGFPIELVSCPFDYSNTSETKSVHFSSKEYTFEDWFGVKVGLPSLCTCVIECAVEAVKGGQFKIPFKVAMLSPRKIDVMSLNLFCTVYNSQLLTKALSNVTTGDAYARNIISFSTASDFEPNDPSSSNPSKADVFRIEPALQHIYGAMGSERKSSSIDFVNLINLTADPQRYRLFLTPHFETSISLEGSLPGFSSLQVPIRFHSKFFSTPESHSFTAFGNLTVLDSDFNQPGMVACQLIGVIDEYLALEVRDLKKFIKFPENSVIESSKRQILYRNKSSLQIFVDIEIENNEDKAQLAYGTDSSGMANPFTVPVKTQTLKPYEVGILDISFRASSSGEFKGKLMLSYLPSVADSKSKIGNDKKNTIGPILLMGTMGTADIIHQPEYLSYGDVDIGDAISQNLVVQNTASFRSSFLLAPSYDIKLEEKFVTLSKGKVKLEIPIKFNPIKPGLLQTQFSFSVAHITHNLNLLGSAGISKMTSNVAVPLRVENLANASDVKAMPDSIYDVGNISLGDTKKFPLHLMNEGSLDFVISKISSNDEKLVAFEPKYTSFVGSAEEVVAFGESNFHKDENDLDNFHYLVEHTKQMSATNRSKNAQFYRKRASSVLSADRRTSQLFGKFPEAQAGPSYGGFSLQDAFPLRVKPFQKFEFTIKINADTLGSFLVPVIVKVTRLRRNPIFYLIWIKGIVLKPLILMTKKIEFGLSPVTVRQYSKITFINEEKRSVKWTINYVNSKFLPSDGFEERHLQHNNIRCPITVFPNHGTLAAGATQDLDLSFVPSIPEAEIFTLLCLKSDDYNEQDVLITSTGASSRLNVEPKELDFGTLRVGTSKSLPIRLENGGMQACSFYLENLHKDFYGEPEEGLLSGIDGEDAIITYQPKKVSQTSGIIRVHFLSKNILAPIDIKVFGAASYPKLVVTSKVIDFGTALYKSVNKRRFDIQNIGLAEALVVFECSHADISLDTSTENALQIMPNQTKAFTILYCPQVVEKLGIKAFIKSSDNRGETFTLFIKGDVGIPKLTIHPKDALESLDFGVMRLNKTYTKSFTVVNDGTIFLSYKTLIEPISITHIGEQENFGKPVQNLMTQLVIFPSEGRLGVGESIEIVISFSPTVLADYSYEFKLTYEYQQFVATIKGVGGRSAPKIMSPVEDFDFELCRIGRSYQKTIQIYNKGNLGFSYKVRPKLESYSPTQLAEGVSNTDSPTSESDQSWIAELAKIGLSILVSDGYCGPESKINIIIEFRPTIEAAIKQEFLFLHDDKVSSFIVSGVSTIAKLHLLDPHTKMVINDKRAVDIDIGVHPVNFTFNYNVELVNPGPFGIDFLLQPMSSMEYEVFPLRGYIEANSTVHIAISFRPSSESKFHTNLRVIWEGESLKANIYGDGGIGRLEIKFLEERDLLIKSLDFGMVPFNTPSRKRFFLSNYGMVGVTAHLETENEDYAVALMGDPILNGIVATFKPTRDTFSSWCNGLKLYLPPNNAIQIGTRFLPRNSTSSVGNITVRSDSGNFTIPLKGKGGTITLQHKGDLEFGDISCNYVYTRKITITNGGSIPSSVSAAWIVVGYASETPEPFVNLSENYSHLDPRSQWARHQLCTELLIDFKSQLKAKDYWQLLILMVRKDSIREARNATMSMSNTTVLQDNSSSKRSMGAGSSNHFKRRQMFYFLITSSQVTSQTIAKVKPFIKVTPPISHLPSYGEATFTVELNLGSEDTFLATLVLRPDIPNAARYEIPLTATPKMVNILCDDTRMLNFYRQPMGETETMTRKFTNLGHKEINFKFINSNTSLTISPFKGVLKVGQTVTVTFSFIPIDESVQSGDVIFEPLNAHPIRFKMYGGGGYAKASLSRYRRFDFGHCMIGKDTISSLPIVNEGNAILHMTKFELQETDTFYRGQGWPTTRISLFPGKNYNLPLVFNPHEENPPPGSLNISTASETFEIELIGLGREAVLIVSKIALEFSECLMGNTYEQKLGLKNIGDVNYPVTCNLEKEFPDITFTPTSLTISPFSESFVTVTYTPSHQTKATVLLTLSSPYSTHKVPIMVHAGVAFLEFSQPDLDFGMFERTIRPSLIMNIKNAGTVKTNFFIKDIAKPSIFSIEPQKGVLLPKKSIDIKVSHIRHEVSNFTEKLAIRTDLVDKIYFAKVTGQCEETVLHENEFALVNMGVCPVLEPSNKEATFTNYGKFPLRFQIQSAYPLKAFPTEGIVAGGETGSVIVTWSPSGAYELRTQLVLSTNIGKYQILVRGKSMFPEVAVTSTYLDFGVCAVGYTYHQNFMLENKGKVKLYYSIPVCKESSYVCSLSQGFLEPKQSIQVDILFTPRTLGKLSGSLIVDCKGIHYKEIVMVGMGGTMNLDFSPKGLNLERCPYGLKLFETIKVFNKGEVTLNVDFSNTKTEQGVCKLELPFAQQVLPSQLASFQIGFSVLSVDRFYAKLCLETKEQSFIIPVTGVGIKITLSKRSMEILQTESFPILHQFDPLFVEPEYLPIEYSIKKIYAKHKKAMDVYDMFALIFGQQISAMEAATEPSEMQLITQRRKRNFNISNIRKLSLAFKEIIGYEDESLTAEPSTKVLEDANVLQPIPPTVKQGPLPPIMPTSSQSESSSATPNVGQEEVGGEEEAERPLETFERLYTPQENLKDEAIEPLNAPQNPLPDSDQVSILDLMAKENDLQKSQQPQNPTVEESKLAVVAAEPSHLPIDIEPTPEATKNQMESSTLDINGILNELKTAYTPFSIVDYRAVESLADIFVDLKCHDFEKEEAICDDPVIESVLVAGIPSIRDSDLDSILFDQANFDPIDLSFITARPPPFKVDDETLKKPRNKKAVEERKGYLTNFPALDRRQRNATGNPFSSFSNSNSSTYGQGVRLYSTFI